CDVDCKLGQTQGAYGAHGIHYFFSNDTDNAASPEVLTEIDAQQWQFAVPTQQPTNVGDPHAAVVRTPLQTLAVPIGLLPGAPPVASSLTASTDPNTPVTVTLEGLDVDTCDLAFTIVTPPTNGALGTLANLACVLGVPSRDQATIDYTPNAA